MTETRNWDGSAAPTVAILLSTYNGERFLEPLLASLDAQVDVSTHLFVRDDGSTDRTPEILTSFACARPGVTITFGPNLGVNDSFWWLLHQASGFDYYAFCDQDDVWLPDKLSRAVRHSRDIPPETPALYGSPVTVVGARGAKTRGEGSAPPVGFANSLLQTAMAGCTMVFSSPGRDLLLRSSPPRGIMYDRWVYQVLSATGLVVRDMESRILYRQHDANVVGSPGLVARWKNAAGRALSRDRGFRVRAAVECLVEVYGDDLSPEAQGVARGFTESSSTVVGRVRYAVTGPWERRSRIETIPFRLLYAMNRL